jgi:hypothetical protein
MKKVALTLILILSLSPFLYAQNTFPPTGNVGIGTTSPQYLLDVQRIGTGNSGAIIGIQGFENSSGTGGYLRLMKSRGATVGTFTTTISGDGFGAVDFMGVNINNAIGYGARIVGRQDGTAGSTYLPGKLSFFLGNTADALSERMTITSSGNVGIGKVTPLATLDVNGVVRVTGPSSNLDVNAAWGNLSNLANSGQMLIGWNRFAGRGEADFIANQGAGDTGGFAFYNHDNNDVEKQLMYIRGDGFVGIGTKTPREALSVNGNIRSKQVTVELVNWPDYVFKPSYQLPSLSEIKTYIDQNQHLPEMPSAEEIAKEGLNLGEMNRLLMKKVEELTLYLIEKDKKEKEQEAVNNKQQEQINQLINQVKVLRQTSTKN